jgi:tetratricopeptide (TPR) repeat protein
MRRDKDLPGVPGRPETVLARWVAWSAPAVVRSRRMRAKLGSAALLCCCLLGPAVLTACGGPAADEEAANLTNAATTDAEWLWLQKARQSLTTRREELAQARKQAPDGEENPALRALELGVRTRTEEFRRRLLEFINRNPPPAGEKASGRTLEALRMKSDEDILVAREHIDEGGDYRTAIDIYEAALAVDPDNPRLREELENAQARRYMTRERFEQVQEGMTADQVRMLLGAPNVNDVREYPERGVTAWFYARDARGGAAAVWFEKKGRNGQPVAYEVDFDALPPS